jgi:choline dehydrogenase-like flavoprotein
LIGPRDDWDEIARITGDADWGWKNAQRRFKSLETYHVGEGEVPSGSRKYLKPKKEDHGYAGPLHIGFEQQWDQHVNNNMDIWAANGYKLNRDIGSGNPLGFAVSPKTVHHGARTTADDLLYPTPSNLQIRTNSPVNRIVFEGKKAVGVALRGGCVLRARKEVILSAGALDTPRILMHSGVGPADQLSRFGIESLVENAQVGQNYSDHYHVVLKFGRAERSNNIIGFFRDKARQAVSLREWRLFRTGDYTRLGTAMNIGFFKSDAVLKSKEFNDLPATEKARLRQPTIPTFEVVMAGIVPEYYSATEATPPMMNVFVFAQNSQGRGSVTLASSDPSVPLDFNPAFVQHPYDKRVIVEATREVLKVTKSKAFLKDAHESLSIIEAPISDSEDDILNFWRNTTGSTWHMSGTTQMGCRDDPKAVVDPQLKVNGVTGLRVADLGIMPIIAR